MTAHERVLATIHRQETDRVPVDIWLTPEVLNALKKHTGEKDEYELYQKLGIDKIAWIFPGYGTNIFDPNDSDGIDPWGVPTIKVKSGLATYQEYGEGPLADYEEISELDDYALWPDPEKFSYAASKALAERARSNISAPEWNVAH